jgi:methionyl-tRNA formyltransferase
MDAGDIALQESTPIGPDETAGELAQRLGKMGARLLLEAMDQAAAGTIRFTPQDPGHVTMCQLFTKEDGRIRWGQPARRIFNLVRAANPWPVAHTLYNGEICRIHRSAVVDTPAAAEPGVITEVLEDRVHVATGEGELAILEFQVPGKRVLPMDAFLRGRPMTPGEHFEDIT